MTASYTYEEGRDAILGIFKTAWDTTGYSVVSWDGSVGEVPTGNDPWARALVRHVTGGAATIGQVGGRRRFRRSGLVTIQLFDRVGDGMTRLDQLAKLVSNAYEKPAAPGHGVWYRNVRVNEVGQSGDWLQLNVIAEFTYDEVH